MKPLRRAALFAVLSVCGAAALAQSVENAPAAAPTPASVALAIQNQLGQLSPSVTASPGELAVKIDAAFAEPGASASQKLAAQYVLSAFASPKALPMVRDLVLKSRVPNAKAVAAGLEILAEPYHKDAALRNSLLRATVSSGLPLHWDALEASQVKRSLDKLFENSKAGRASDGVVDTRGPPEAGDAKVKAVLGKPGALERRDFPEDANLERLRRNFLNERGAAASLSEQTREALDPAALADVDLHEVVELEQAPQDRAVPAHHREAQEKLLAGPLAKPEFQPDFVDIGMGPTGMMTMLAAIASGRTAVGVEMRGKPTRGVHQNIREEWFHMLGLIDQMMVKRYGIDGVPKLPNGKPWMLADFFYNAERVGGSLDFPDLYPKKDPEQAQNVAGRLTRVLFEDARDATKAGNDGKAVVYVLPPPTIPERADPAKVRGDMKAVLEGPSVFQVALINYELMLRSYLKAMEVQDKRAGRKPRVKLYESNRVVQDNGDAIGYIPAGRGRERIIIEDVQESRDGGKAERTRKPGTIPIDLGTPLRFALTAGFGGGADARALGYKQEDVLYHDPTTGEQVPAKQNWISGEVTANVGGQLLRRISTAVDPKTGKKETLRQIAVGHEGAPNVAWVLAQVPDFAVLDPIAAGKVPAGTDPKSPEYKAAAQSVLRDYYIKEVSDIVHIPEADIAKMRMFYGPNLFTLTEKIGKTARVASNGNVAGDLMGNGHFLTSGGAMTGMIGHTHCYLEYWRNIASGMPQEQAARILEAEIRKNSEAWLHVSAKEFFDLLPANFGEERANAINVNSADITDAGQSKTKGFGLASILGQATWVESFRKLMRGEFGVAHKDFYVPDKEVDLTASPDVKVERVNLPPKH